MRILFLAHLWRALDTTDDKHVMCSLELLGHEVVAFDPRQWLNALNASGAFDFVLVTKGIRAELVQQLKDRFNAPVLYWCFDGMTLDGAWPPRPVHLVPAVAADAYLSPELGLANKYKAAGAHFFYLPMDVAPTEWDPERRLVKRYQRAVALVDWLTLAGPMPVIFTGTWHWRALERAETLCQIQAGLDVPLHIFGNNSGLWQSKGFQYGHDEIWENGFRYLVAHSLICLGLDSEFGVEGSWSNRPARYMICGGFTLLHYVTGMERTFGPDGENLVYWHDAAECIDKIRYFLEHADERAAIAARGQRFAEENLTIERRVGQMLAIAEEVRRG